MSMRLLPGVGSPQPRGASVVENGVNFSVYSETAEAIWVCIFDDADNEIGRFALEGRAGAIWYGVVAGVGAGVLYGLRADGPHDPSQGFYFDPDKLLVDPYARAIDRGYVRDKQLCLPRGKAGDTAPSVPKGIVLADEYAVAKLDKASGTPGFVYELNVRGYTMQFPEMAEPLRGTVSGLMDAQVLAHLTDLGVDVVELMPVAAWIDEGHLPALGLTNAWGYNPVNYFCPDPRLMPGGMAELRAMTDAYRAQGISVILDVVYNHTGESDLVGPVISMKGLDARTYYRHQDVDGRLELVNDTGTGNTLRCAHPEVQNLVIDSLRYWVEAGGVSGFRFDLAPVLGRDANGFKADAQLLERIKTDDVLSQCLLVAEPWDPGPGGYQLGQFGPEFCEWNDKYRDDVRAFWQGSAHGVGALAQRVAGSSDVFGDRLPNAGFNFLAVHDGFTLMDTVSYVHKHNEANGENNRDGHGHNLSWNNGVEGATDDPMIVAARQRDVRALLATLFMSRGVPMIQQGDEMGRTQSGNNNAYAQDNDLAWVDWAGADLELATYVAQLAKFRRKHIAIYADRFLTGTSYEGVRDVVWLRVDGAELTDADWHDGDARMLGMHLNSEGDEVLVWFNGAQEDIKVTCPPSASGTWRFGLASSDMVSPDTGGTFMCPARSVVALV